MTLVDERSSISPSLSFVKLYLLCCNCFILEKGGEPRVADFIHGSDGLGNLFLPSPKSKKIVKSAAEFLVDKVSEYPGEVSILALGPLTNIALVTCYHLLSLIRLLIETCYLLIL